MEKPKFLISWSFLKEVLLKILLVGFTFFVPVTVFWNNVMPFLFGSAVRVLMPWEAFVLAVVIFAPMIEFIVWIVLIYRNGQKD